MRAKDFISESTLALSKNDAAKAWIKKVHDQFQPWPMNQAQRVIVVGGEGEDQQFAWFELVPNRIWSSDITRRT